MKAFERFVPLLLSAVPLSCTLDDDKRCEEGFVYQAGYCVIEDEDTDSETDTDTDEEDAGVTGLGLPCEDQGDCEGYEADYCAIAPGATEGQCAVSDCVVDPDDCPADLQCCDFPATGMTAGMPNLCLPAEEYETYSGMGMCNG